MRASWPVVLLVPLVFGCEGASGPVGTGRIRFEITGESGVALEAVSVAVLPSRPGTGIQWRSERVILTGGRGELDLPEGLYDLWVGAPLSPVARLPRIVPEMIQVDVRADAETTVSAHLKLGGVARVPASLGLPPASHGRLRAICSQGSVKVERWIRLRPSGQNEDVLWPPLPEGEWIVVVELADGSQADLAVRIDRNDKHDAPLTRR